MATTYADDDDITAWDSAAGGYLPAGVSTFDAVRTKAYQEIGRRLSRREPAIDQSVLGLIDELKHAEVLFALHALYFQAAAKVADDSMLNWRSKQYRDDFEAEMANVRIPADTDDFNAALRSVKTVPIYRR